MGGKPLLPYTTPLVKTTITTWGRRYAFDAPHHHTQNRSSISITTNTSATMGQKRQLGPRLTKSTSGGQKGNQNGKGGKGGAAPKGNNNPLKHGLYAVGFTEEEKGLLPHVQLGSVQDELQMAKLMLRRACRAQLMWESQKGIFNEQVRQGIKAALGSTVAAELFNVESIELKEAVITAQVIADGEDIPITLNTPTAETKVIRRKTDYSAEILKYARLIISLEEMQLKLMEEGGGEDYARRLADDIREFGDAALATLPGNQIPRGEYL